MQDFDYAAPATLQEALALLADHNGAARPLAGGTDLIDQLRAGRRSARLVVDVKRIPELMRLELGPHGLYIGAAVPCYRIYEDAEIARAYPGLVDAASLIGGIQIQSRASFGGNLCNASPAADSIPALIAHHAVCVIVGTGVSPVSFREVPVEHFCTAPGRTILGPGELLTALKVPGPPANFGARYLRFIPRNEMDIAVVGAGVSVVLDDSGKTIVSARLALGAAAPTPLLVQSASERLAGRPVSDEALEIVAQCAREAARPIDDMRGRADQRRHLAGVLARRALADAIARCATAADASAKRR